MMRYRPNNTNTPDVRSAGNAIYLTWIDHPPLGVERLFDFFGKDSLRVFGSDLIKTLSDTVIILNGNFYIDHDP